MSAVTLAGSSNALKRHLCHFLVIMFILHIHWLNIYQKFLFKMV